MDYLVMAGASTRPCSINDCIQLALSCGFCHTVHLENHSSCLELPTSSTTARNTWFRWSDNSSAEYYRAGWALLQRPSSTDAFGFRGAARTGTNAVLVWVLTHRNR